MNFQTAYPTHKFGNRKKKPHKEERLLRPSFLRKRDKEIQSVPKTSCFCSQRQNKRSHETKKNFLLLEGKNALYGQVFCTVVTKRFGGFQKHLVFILNVKIKDRMRTKEFSFARREDCLRSTSFLQACIKDVLGVTNTCSSGSQRWNLKKWKLHFNFCLLNKKFFPLFECWWKKFYFKGLEWVREI